MPSEPLVYPSDNLLESIEKILSGPEDLRPSHCDMNLYNLYLDLATRANYFFYDNVDTSRHFLNQYFGGALSQDQQYKLPMMRTVSLIYAGITFLLMLSKSSQPLLSIGKFQQPPSYADYMKLIGASKNLNDPLVQQEYALVCFKEVLRLVDHPHYSAALEKRVNRSPSPKK